MKNTRHRILPLSPLAALAFAAAGAIAQQKAPAPAPEIDLQDGDTFVFLGDSITHQCLYTQYIEDFFYTRYPDRKLHFHNAGVSGDKAADALARFDDDVAAYRPKHVSILLGMNDGQYEPFSPEVFATYADGMTEILDRIGRTGAKALVMSPTMFDHHQLGLRMKDETYRFRERSFDPHYNSLLAYYAGWLRETAGARGLSFINQWGPMNDVTFDTRIAQPDFSLVPDAIHPGAAGQFLMAFELVRQATPDRKAVSAIGITPRANGKWIAGKEVADLEVSPGADRVTFTHTASALPWVVPAEAFTDPQKWEAEPAADLAYRFTAAGHKLSNERLKVAGLAPGNYAVTIDGVEVGRYSHLALGAKVELQANARTPQYRQALDVATLNRERNDKAMRPLRDLWGQVKGLGRKHASDPEKFAAEYAALQPRLDELKTLAADHETRIHQAAQPQPRKYEIARVPE
ncbi:MAG: SGNH/GDSL hydrolase family protein [Akkermansiaceae bacterium]|nr:SGNH/GDSL hydrolase family protein [Akkermansiaceae bacterium]MCP5551145.1 SGNH/GDSL hydrolase family protein [Akkermansiaceae bacterium]